MVEAEEEEKDILDTVGGPQDIVEDPFTTEIVEGEEKPMTRNTRSGMTGNQLAQVEEKDHKMSSVTTAVTVNHKADPKGKNLQGTTQESLLRRKRELEVPVQIDTIEEKEA